MSIFEYDKEEEERKLRKTEYEAGVAAGFSDGFNNGFNSGINTAKKDTVRLHIAKSSWFDRRLLSGTILTSIFPDKRCRDQFSFPAEYCQDIYIHFSCHYKTPALSYP